VAITLAPSWLRAQAPPKPVVSPGGVVNAASFALPSQPGYGISPGSIASIFGTNLAAAEASAPSVPLPKQLAGTTVTFDGIPAPLFYASPGQINAQVPNASSINPVVVVATAGGSSDPVQVGGNGSLGLFTTGATGCGRGAILNVGPDGTLSPNTPQNSAAPGGYIAAFGTGLWSSFLCYGPPPPDGYPATSDPLTWYCGDALAAQVRDQYADTQFVGLAPGLVGVDQYNIQLSADVPQGCQIPFRVTDIRWTSSQPVLVSVHEGGGACVPNLQSAGVLRWQKVVSSDASGTTTAESLFVDLSAGESKGPPQPLTPQPSEGWDLHAYPPGPKCPDAEDKTLDAGMLVAYGPGGAGVRISPALSDGKLLYTQALPPGTIGPGTYGVVALGGKDVGSFGTTVTIPTPIQVTTALPPGSFIPGNANFVVTWTGGNPEDVVSAQIFSIDGERLGEEYAASAASGEVWLPVVGSCPPPRFIGNCSLPAGPGPVEVVVTHTAAADATTFQATGLTLGGWHEWMYQFRFSGLTVQ
jgi:uncharacterized protein (TIGR03437 family)